MFFLLSIHILTRKGVKNLDSVIYVLVGFSFLVIFFLTLGSSLRFSRFEHRYSLAAFTVTIQGAIVFQDITKHKFSD